MSRRTALLIDTSVGNEQVELALARAEDDQDGSMIAERTVGFSSNDSQSLLAAMTKLLSDHGESIGSLHGFGLVQGAERFTISRLSAVITNAASWSIQRPAVEFAQRPSAADFLAELATADATPGAKGVHPIAGLTPAYSKDPTITLK